MKIAQKLISGYVLIALLTGVVGFFGIRATTFLDKDFQKVCAETLPTVQALEEMRFAGLRVVSSACELALLVDERRFAGQTSQQEFGEESLIESGKDHFFAALYKYQKVAVYDPLEKGLVSRINSAFKSLVETSNELVSLKKQGISGERIVNIKERFEREETAFLKTVSDAIAHKKEELSQRKEVVALAVTSVKNGVAVVSILVFITSLIAGTIISKSISVPIVRLSRAVRQVGKGKLETRFALDAAAETKGRQFFDPLRETKEVRILVNSFNCMAEDLEKTTVSRNYVDSILKSMNDALLIVWLDGKIRGVNQAACSLLGYTEDELVGHSVMMVLGRDAGWETSTGQIPSWPQSVGVYESIFYGQNGRTIPVSLSVAELQDELQGGPEGYVLVAQDITDRKKAEDAIRKSEERARRQQHAIVKLMRNMSVAGEDLKKHLQAITEEAARALEVERASVWLLSSDFQRLDCVDLFEAGSQRHTENHTLNIIEYPRYFDALNTQRAVVADDARANDFTSEFADNYLADFGITSMLDTPIRMSGEVVGVVCCEHTGELRQWSPDEISFAGQIADQTMQVLCNAKSKKAEAELKKAYEELELRVYARTSELKAANEQLILEIKERQRAEEVLRTVAEGISGVTGEALFLSLAQYLTKTLGVDHALIGEIVDQDQGIAETVAVCSNGKIEDNFRFSITDMPLNKTEISQFDMCPEWIRKAFTKDSPMAVKGVESYIGIPLFDSSACPIGLIAVMDSSPIAATELLSSMFRIFAVRAAAEMERQKQEEALHKARNLESIGRLAAGIAHEINNPLTNASLKLERLKNKFKSPAGKAPMYSKLEYVERNIDRASAIARELLLFSRPSETKFVPVDINRVINECFSLLTENLEKVTIKTSLGDFPELMGDPLKLQGLFINILNNAVDAMPEGGSIFVKTAYIGDQVIVKITDTGTGIAEDNKSKVFEPFFSTKEIGAGTGLGLSICYGIVQQHNGSIEIESARGKGTTVTVKLPLPNGAEI